MPTLNDIKTQLYSDPEFTKLPYRSQLNVWNKYMSQYLQKDPEFMKMGKVAQNQVINNYSVIAPSIKSTNPDVLQMLQNGKDLQRGRLDPNITPEQLEEYEKYLGKTVNSDAFLSSMLSTGIGKVTYPLVKSVIGQDKGELGLDIIYDEDAEKVRDYYRILLQNTQQSKSEAAVSFLGGFLGEAAGYIAMRGPTGAIAAKVGSVLASGAKAINAPAWIQKSMNLLNTIGATQHGTKTSINAAKSALRAGNTGLKAWATGTFIPWMADATLDGIAGLTMQEVGNIAEGKGNTIFERGFMSNLKNFGAYAAGDYAFGTFAAIVAPALQLGAKVVGSTFKLKNAKLLGFKNATELTRALAGIDEITPAHRRWMQDAAPQALDVIDHKRTVLQFEANGVEAFKDPIQSTWITADKLNKIVVPEGTGFRVRDAGNLVEGIKSVDSFRELQETLVNAYNKATPQQIEALAKSGGKYEWLKRQAEITNTINSPITNSGRGGDFVNISQRQFIHPVEFDSLLKNSQISDYNVAKGTLGKTGDGSFVLRPEDGDYMTIVKNLADSNQYVDALRIGSKFQGKGSTINVEQLADNVLLNRGYDAVQLADGSIRPLMNNRIKRIVGNVNLETGKIIDDGFVKKGMKLDPDIEVIRNTKSVLKDINSISDVKQLNLGNTEQVVKKIADDYAMSVGKKFDINVKKTDGPLSVVGNGKNLDISLPRNLDAAAQSDLIKQITKQVNNLNGKPFTSTITTSPAKSNVLPGASKFDQTKYLREQIKKSGGTLDLVDGKYQVTFGDTVRFFNDSDQAYKYLLLNDMGEKSLIATMESAGYKIITDNEGTRIMMNGEEIIKTNQPFAETFLNSNEDFLKIPSTLEQNVGILDNGTTIEITDSFVAGNKNDLLKHFSKFEDYNHLGSLDNITTTPKGSLYETLSETFEVRSNKYGYVKKFNNIREARLFLENIDSFENVMHMAKDKGLQISFKKDIFEVSGNGKNWSGKNLDDLTRIIKDNPTPTSYPNIYPDPEIDALLKDLPVDVEFANVKPFNPEVHNPYVPKTQGEVKELGALKSISTQVMPTTAWITNAATQIGDNTLLGLYTNLEDSVRLATKNSAELTTVLDRIFTDPNGKFLSVNERKLVYHLTTGTDSTALSTMAKEFDIAITPELRAVSDNMRVMFDDLFNKFGLKSEKFLNEYLPRLYKYAHDTDFSSTMTAKELFDGAFNKNVPSEMKVFFEHDRATEIVKGILNDDAYAVALQYIDKGSRKLYMEKSFKELVDFTNKSPNMDGVLKHRLVNYLERLNGGAKTAEMKIANEGVRRILQKILPKKYLTNKPNMDSLVNSMMSLNYMSSMGLKPWLGIRNTMQPWITLAPRFGNGPVAEAYQQVAKNGESILKEMVDAGVITRTDPIMIKLADNFIGKTTSKFLKGFKTSDEITRAVAYQTTKLKYMEGIEKLQSGVIRNIDDFEKFVGLNLIDNTRVRDVVKGLIQEGEVDAGLHRFSTQVIEETMFPYRPTERPMFGNKTLFGKFFWQYGTYSSNYAANMVRGLKNGSTAQKIGFVTTLAANSAIIGGVLTGLGISNNNFIPWTPMMFTGGPLIDTSYDMIKSLGTGYEADAARQRLKAFVLPRKMKDGSIVFGDIMPFSYQIRNIQKGLKALEQGDTWNAWLFFTSTPLSPENSKNYS